MNSNDREKPEFIDGPPGRAKERIAYRSLSVRSVGQGADQALPGLIWLGGFRSDMMGSKASMVAGYAERFGQDYLRFDYSGHGESGGKFRDGTISSWTEDASLVLEQLTSGPQILIGSSMGGWISMLLALKHPGRIAGMVLIAPAPDFTEDLMWAGMDQAARKEIITKGFAETPSDYSDEPDIITHALIEDGRRNLVLDKKIGFNGPVRILQGMKDQDVPWQHAIKAVDCFESSDIVVSLIKSGDHRLSTVEDLKRLTDTIEEVSKKAAS